MSSHRITDLYDAIDGSDATTLSQVEQLIAASPGGLPANSSLASIASMNPSVGPITVSG